MNLMVLRATINYLVVLLKIKNVGPILSTWFLVEIRLTCLVVPLRCCQLAFELGVTFSLVPILPGYYGGECRLLCMILLEQDLWFTNKMVHIRTLDQVH